MMTPTNATADDATFVIDREVEFDLLSREVEARLEGPRREHSVINLYGPDGIGKSTFLHRIALPYLRQHAARLPYALVDFDPAHGGSRYLDEEGQATTHGRARLALDLAEQLAGGGQDGDHLDVAWPEEFRRAVEAWQDNPDEATEDELIYQFNHSLIPHLIVPAGGSPRPVVILMDTADRLAAKTLEWLQSELQSPTTPTGYVLFVVASHSRLECYPFYLRLQFSSHPLGAFGPDAVRQQIALQAQTYTALADEIYHLSYGLPEATRVTVERLDSLAQAHPELALDELFAAYRGELVGAIEQLLTRYLADVADEQLIDGMRILSLVRLFNISIVNQLLPDLLRSYRGEQYKPIEPMLFIRRLQGTKLVDWDTVRDGYVIEKPIRQLMAQVLRERRFDLYTEMHKRALAKYNEWREQSPKRIDYLLEAMYHQATLTLLPGRTETDLAAATVRLQQFVRQAVDRHYLGAADEHRTLRDELRQRIESDDDLAIMLGKENRNTLLYMVDVLADNHAAAVDATENTLEG